MARTKKENRYEVRTSIIRLRVNAQEEMILKDRAAKTGCKTVSQYIRLKCLNDNKKDVIIDYDE